MRADAYILLIYLSFALVGGAEKNESVFVATHEWQTVKKGECPARFPGMGYRDYFAPTTTGLSSRVTPRQSYSQRGYRLVTRHKDNNAFLMSSSGTHALRRAILRNSPGAAPPRAKNSADALRYSRPEHAPSDVRSSRIARCKFGKFCVAIRSHRNYRSLHSILWSIAVIHVFLF